MSKKLLLVIAGLILTVNGNVQAAGNATSGGTKAAVCRSCHGQEGISSISIYPNLAGQVPGYIAAQLKAYQSGERINTVMSAQVSQLTEADMADLDAYFASLPAKVTATMTDEDKALAEAGRAIYRGGFAARGISACMSCHGPSGHGIPKNYPRISAQHKEYLEQQLLAYKKGDRKGHNEIMVDIAFGLSELQIKQLAAYISGLN